ncbi:MULTISPECIES: DUF6114 domain-containing protein [unclassified Streptomyces]|uniref:DUF6114 domain-containing protein n=1 Tax=unclassified Streptomyces TaxID=2593676 RepID=UPI002254BCEB|nr:MULTISPECIES: DUF6114 domain-containing protein [unclassified Streptomyces]MCX5142999.1 DUF6114 domain-containing protein [Streptomyces sp. NBC_00338]WRZ67438.1 DUF6114 domain-containing protein [Streptomyces sp. NBC_01257]WSU61428.1 DUF6114 domain-containing protein [Streptomyces sp. NBC_01104]
MSPESQGQNEHYLSVVRRRFRTWRGNRPFWAGLFTMLGGVPIAYFPYANMHLGNMTLAMSTTAGAGSLIIGVLLVTLGLTMWFHHIVRVFAGVAAILLALISIPVANIGGFLIGFLFALIGGALSVSWVPGKPQPDEAAPDQGLLGEADEPVLLGDEAPGAPSYAQEEHAAAYPGGALHGMGVPEQQPAKYDTTVEVDGGRHRAG